MFDFKMSFVKEDGKWYAVIPTWTGPKAALEMVAGADSMLDWYSGFNTSCEMQIKSEPFTETEYFSTLEYLKDAKEEYGEGAFYKWNRYGDIIWLCDVMLFVFNEFPKMIYIRLI